MADRRLALPAQRYLRPTPARETALPRPGGSRACVVDGVVERSQDPDRQLGRAAAVDELQQAVEIPATVSGELLRELPREPALA